MASRNGVVLIIDDESGLPTKRLLDGAVHSVVRHPNDVSDADLRRAKLALVDYRLDHWPEREDQRTPSLKPKDGRALIAVLRSNLRKFKAGPKAFALNSGVLSELSGGGDWPGREHAIARSIDLEWVFGKESRNEQFSTAVKSLADAVAELPTRWTPSSTTKTKILSLLEVPKKVSWRQSVLETIDRSRPPHEILIQNSSGIAVLRWLLHEILPFPTFLLSERYISARLRLEPNSLSRVLKSADGKKIKRGLFPFEYRGILSDFAGARWWRAGIEYWIWQNTKGRAFERSAIEKLVRSKLSKRLEFANLSDPVVSLDDQLRPSDQLIELKDAVEIKPDGWPSFADAAWIPKDLANDPAFVALVPHNER